MGKDILSMYGNDASRFTGRVARAECGGVESAKPLRYSPPTGPKDQYVGMSAGTNHGNKDMQGRH